MTRVEPFAGSVLIVDSGMRSVGGHNFSHTSAVQRALERQGRNVTVLSNRGLPSERAFARSFLTSAASGVVLTVPLALMLGWGLSTWVGPDLVPPNALVVALCFYL